MIVKIYKYAIEYPIPREITTGHPLWDNHWRCCVRAFLGIRFVWWGKK